MTFQDCILNTWEFSENQGTSSANLLVMRDEHSNQSILLRLVYGYVTELTNEEVAPYFYQNGQPMTLIYMNI